jgi:hypothetical protein
MLLYHGSTQIVEKPEILKSDFGKDFGFGFYTTNLREQAERWAMRKARILNQSPILNIYHFDQSIATKQLSIKTFESPTLEWLEFVIENRTMSQSDPVFDMVIGAIANDNVGETVLYVMNGIMRKEDALERLKFQKINQQTVFNSDKSLKYLVFKEALRL